MDLSKELDTQLDRPSKDFDPLRGRAELGAMIRKAAGLAPFGAEIDRALNVMTAERLITALSAQGCMITRIPLDAAPPRRPVGAG